MGVATFILCYFIFVKEIVFEIGESVVRFGLPQAAFIIIVLALPMIWIRSDAVVTFLRSIDSDDPDKSDRVLLACILFYLIAIGFSLRFANLDEFGLVVDESLFIYSAGHGTLAEAIRESSVHFHPPGNFAMLFLQLKLSWDPTWLRMGSVLSGTYLIWISYLFGRQLFRPSSGLMVALLVTFSANLVLLSRVCRNYSPYFAFLVTALYFLARFSKEGRWVWFYWYAAFGCLASLWHYGAIVLLLGTNLWVAGTFALDRRPLRDWTKAFFAQVPIGLVFLGALFIHLPVTMQGQRDRVVKYMADEFTLSLFHPYAPIHSLIRYLVEDLRRDTVSWTGVIFSALFVLGVLALWMTKRRRELLFCLASIPPAYILAFAAQRIPLGGTRHGAHLFPILFAVIGFFVSAVVTTYPRVLDSALQKFRKGKPGGSSGRILARCGVMVMGAVCMLYVQRSLGLYAYETPYEERQKVEHIQIGAFYKANFYKVVEAPTRTEDLERVRSALVQYVGPNDVVLATYAGFLILRYYLEDPHQAVFFDLDTPTSFSHGGITIHYSPETRWDHAPEYTTRGVADLGRRMDLTNLEKVWAVGAGWEIWTSSLVGWYDRVYPEMLIDTPAVRESRGLVFAVDGQAALAEGERLLREDAAADEK